MKELTIEQKAQRYDEAFGMAKKWYNAPNINKIPTYGNRVIEEIFPELKEENEDEKIRNFISNELACLRATEGKGSDRYEELTNAIAWLEKQGESKSYSWKPSKEQFEALDYAYNSCSDTERGNYYEGVLETLIEDLHRLEKQGEQPRYSIGDVLCDKSCTTLDKDAQPNFEIVDIKDGMYICDKGSFPISQQDEYELAAIRLSEELLPLAQKEQKPAWKPSDEQMKALNYVVNLMASSESPRENDYYYNVFKDLRKQLKKLREE